MLDTIEKELATPSLSQAKRMKELSHEDKLTPEAIDAIMSEEKKEVEKVTFIGKRLKKYFPRFVTPKEIEETIINLLENWYEQQQQPVQ